MGDMAARTETHRADAPIRSEQQCCGLDETENGRGSEWGWLLLNASPELRAACPRRRRAPPNGRIPRWPRG